VSGQGDACVDQWWDGAGTHFVDFIDTVSVAEVTPKIQLAPMLLEMYRTLRAFQRSEHPECVENAQEAIDAFMLEEIDAFRNYMLEQQSDEPDTSGFETALDKFQDALTELTVLGYTFDIDAGELCPLVGDCP
jgi:hypothetical protein